MRTIRNCNVAVVGGAGFLGSHLVNYLVDDRQCNVLVLDNLISGRREFVHPKARFAHCDITGSEAYMHNLFRGCEYVWNYAAEPYIPVSFERPLHTFMTNAVGALQVINAAYEAGVKGIMQISSAELYGACIASDLAGTDGRITEDIPVSPHSTYGCAKAAIDYLVQCRWKEAKVPCIALRQFNCIGSRETHDYIVPTIISQLHAQQVREYFPGGDITPSDVTYRGTGETATIKLGNNSFRDFQYAGDAVEMAVQLLETERYGEVFNMGSEEGIKIYDLAVLIGKLMGFENVVVGTDKSRIRPWEIWYLRSDNTKLYAAIGKHVHTPLEEALKRTIKWFQNNGNKWAWQ